MRPVLIPDCVDWRIVATDGVVVADLLTEREAREGVADLIVDGDAVEGQVRAEAVWQTRQLAEWVEGTVELHAEVKSHSGTVWGISWIEHYCRLLHSAVLAGLNDRPVRAALVDQYPTLGPAFAVFGLGRFAQAEIDRRRTVPSCSACGTTAGCLAAPGTGYPRHLCRPSVLRAPSEAHPPEASPVAATVSGDG